MENVIDIEGIMRLLPHRIPFIMVDRIAELDADGGVIVGLKNVTINEWFFQGHFPSQKVMPGVLIVEALAQTGGVLLMKQLGDLCDDKLVYFMTIEKAKFRKPVVPGDQLRLEVKQTVVRGSYSKMEGKVWVGDNLVTEANMTSAVVDKPKK
ncbi:3-hydroxyacyl-ACP dehydratase FabZ [bacterium]|nr:3-hydroxyacyl-ACP dehydratase FabZ [bacterium]